MGKGRRDVLLCVLCTLPLPAKVQKQETLGLNSEGKVIFCADTEGCDTFCVIGGRYVTFQPGQAHGTGKGLVLRASGHEVTYSSAGGEDASSLIKKSLVLCA